jgi:signal transduction histidine kinase/ligand-binding sensor domain-containing protein
MRIWGFLYCLLVLLCFTRQSAAQTEVWRRMDIADIVNANITCLTEDKSGLIYVGTHEGVEIFDGRNFHSIEVPGRIKKGINPFVQHIFWAVDGKLWVVTRSHIYTYDPATAAVKVVYSNPSNMALLEITMDAPKRRMYLVHTGGVKVCSMSDTSVTFLYDAPLVNITKPVIGAQGELYLLQNNDKLYRLKDKKVEYLYGAPMIKDCAYMPLQRRLVFITPEGLKALDPETKQVAALQVPGRWDCSSPKTRVTALSDGRLVVHHENGIGILNDINDDYLTHYQPEEKNEWSIKAGFIVAVFVDKHKNLWVAEDGVGISVLPYAAKGLQFVPAKIVGAERLWKMHHDSLRNQVFAFSENGLCAIHLTGGRATYQPNIRPAGIKHFEVMGVVPMDENKLLLLTNGQGSWLFDMVSYKLAPYVFLDKNIKHKAIYGTLQMGTGRYMLYGPSGTFVFDKNVPSVKEILHEDTSAIPATALESAGRYSVLSVCKDREGHIWFGMGGGIDVLDSNYKLLRQYGKKGPGQNNGLGNTVILDIKEAGDGTIYVATMGGGAYRLERNHIFTHIPLAGNLDNIYCIAVIDKEHLVFTTSKGMCLYTIPTGESRLLNDVNGMPITDFNQFALGHDDKYLLAAGARGVVIMPRENLLGHFYDTAQLRVMRGPLAIDAFTLDKGVHTLGFDVAIPGYAANNDWQIQYKLDGVDDNWRDMSRGEWQIHYNSLQPGSYKLLVKATDRQGVFFVKPASVDIVVLPFFWQATWFRLVALALAVGLLVLIVRFFSQLSLKWKLRKLVAEQKVANERMRISRELHDNVGSQLTSIIAGLETTGLLLKKQPDIVEKKLENLHTAARASMHQLRDSVWALNSEHIAVSALVARFDTWLRNITDPYPDLKVSLHTEVADDVVLDPVKGLNLFRMMQESVHNVLKHARATKLDITYVATDGKLTIVITDNGKGFDPAGTTGNGTRFMAARAEEIGVASNISSGVGKGTQVNIVAYLK